ncbi:tripartite tricarboxylate transporter substrate binding protein [Hydrogenophaga sp.]|uniref:Bug family tripartite tricarboxylate transporter substrate binding protein n=1 Tax=Hydrogenophaga sp. TaxID=1904254 RepID=UPI002725A849|nr:tripartite tricarboxylate transporter substrate binding protein [Hydrogenophaga sp.]MDO9437638.1 tripartite tricarboxylate transporter substrate binding protein [Hydrogenophaga sp.]
MRHTCLALLATALVGCTSLATAQSGYPARPIQIVLPAPPGGYYDRVARILGNQLSQQMGVPVVIDNKDGANGAIGSALAARAAPDGYTLVIGAIGPFGIAPALDEKLQYDPIKDFAPIALLTTMPTTLLVSASSPYKTVRDFVAATKSRTQPTLYGSFGLGTSSHLTMERFRVATGAKLSNVPYRGSPPAILAVVSGEVEATFSNVQDALPNVRGGKVRALAVAGNKRVAALPDTPSFAEVGLPQIDSSNWLGLLAPAKTPPAIVQRLNTEVNKALADADVRRQMAPAGELLILGGTVADFEKHMLADMARWKEVVKAGNIKKE